MKKKPLICVLLFIGLAACKNNDDTLRFKALTEGLKKYETIVRSNNDIIVTQLKEKSQDPQTAAKAAIWQPRAAYIKAVADSMTSYIGVLQTELKKEAGLGKNGQDAGENDRDAIKMIFEKHGGTDSLYHKLIDFNEKAVSALMPDDFADNPVLREDVRKARDQIRNNFPVNKDTPIAAWFKNTGSAGASAMLNKLQNDVIITENELLSYCNSMVTADVIIHDEFFSPIAFQSSSYLKAGELLEITAGIGSFNVAVRPRITIDGKNIPLDPDGIAIYRIKAPGKAGKHIIPVKIEFTKPDGSLSFITKKIEYTVAE